MAVVVFSWNQKINLKIQLISIRRKKKSAKKRKPTKTNPNYSLCGCEEGPTGKKYLPVILTSHGYCPAFLTPWTSPCDEINDKFKE